MYANGDINKLLKIKAESTQISYASFVLGLFSMMSMFVANCSLLLDIIEVTQVISLLVLGVLCFSIFKLKTCMTKFKDVRKNENYLIVAIDEVEKEYRENN